MDRRDFLKYFGAGATVLPVVGGVPAAHAAGKLVDPPKIEPVEFHVEPMSSNSLDNLPLQAGRQVFITVDVWTADRERIIRFQAESFITRVKTERIDVSTFIGFMRPVPGTTSRAAFIAGPTEWQFTIEGVCTGHSPLVQSFKP